MKQLLEEALKKLDVIKTLASITVLVAFLVVLYALIFKIIPPENKEALINILGIIEGAVMAIISFYFGSSKSSQAKDEHIQDLNNKK
jgi:amino acid transporter